MPVSKDRSGRWRAVLKNRREYVAGKTFDTKREAEAWLAREKAALTGGTDPRAGQVTVRTMFATYMEARRHTVAVKTYRSDMEMVKLMPPNLASLHVGRVTDREIQRVLDAWSRRYAESSVRRFRAVLSGFFAWSVRERLRIDNPVTRTSVAHQFLPTSGMQPFTEDELDEVRADIAVHDQHLADVVWLLAWTGLRWSEARELRVADLIQVPMPRLLIRRSAPETVEAKPTKSGRSRHVPLSDELLPVIRSMANGKGPSDLLITSPVCTRRHSNAPPTGPPQDGVAGFTTSGTPPRASGLPPACPLRPSRHGWPLVVADDPDLRALPRRLRRQSRSGVPQPAGARPGHAPQIVKVIFRWSPRQESNPRHPHYK